LPWIQLMQEELDSLMTNPTDDYEAELKNLN